MNTGKEFPSACIRFPSSPSIVRRTSRPVASPTDFAVFAPFARQKNRTIYEKHFAKSGEHLDVNGRRIFSAIHIQPKYNYELSKYIRSSLR
jgi:hypothetical protein